MANSDSSGNVINKLIEDYSDHQDMYTKVAEFAYQICQRELQIKFVKAIITHRHKQPNSLKTKLKRIQQERLERGKTELRTIQEVRDNVCDLAGVRIALYFPNDADIVRDAINPTFNLNWNSGGFEKQKEWNRGDRHGDAELDYSQRFPGYNARHFRVKLPKEYLGLKIEGQHQKVIVEIQVATVLMHAWQEVNHDLLYKPLSGELSVQEKISLDLINGVAHSGEVALKLLYNAFTERVDALERPFADMYELGTWLKGFSKCVYMTNQMGYLDTLLMLLELLNLNLPKKLRPRYDRIPNASQLRELDEKYHDKLEKDISIFIIMGLLNCGTELLKAPAQIWLKGEVGRALELKKLHPLNIFSRNEIRQKTSIMFSTIVWHHYLWTDLDWNLRFQGPSFRSLVCSLNDHWNLVDQSDTSSTISNKEKESVELLWSQFKRRASCERRFAIAFALSREGLLSNIFVRSLTSYSIGRPTFLDDSTPNSELLLVRIGRVEEHRSINSVRAIRKQLQKLSNGPTPGTAVAHAAPRSRM